jgi:hypothetical protein|tara:strand:- start:36 stop:488 length:453 start_codon:yes stop_codon:yes gene_type:complete
MGITNIWTWAKVIELCKVHRVEAAEAAAVINEHINRNKFKGQNFVNFIIAALVKEQTDKKKSDYAAIKLVITKYKKLYKPKEKIIWSVKEAPRKKNPKGVVYTAETNYKNHIELIRNRIKRAYNHEHWKKFYNDVWPKVKKNKQLKKDFL